MRVGARNVRRHASRFRAVSHDGGGRAAGVQRAEVAGTTSGARAVRLRCRLAEGEQVNPTCERCIRGFCPEHDERCPKCGEPAHNAGLEQFVNGYTGSTECSTPTRTVVMSFPEFYDWFCGR